MKRYSKINFLGTLLLLCLIGCSDNRVDYGEQYKKTLYIINSRDMLYVGEHAYGVENTMEISVYCASSQPIKKDMDVTLKIDAQALDSLNKKSALGNPLYVDKEMLPEANYKMGEPAVTIRKNEQYGVLKIALSIDGLDPDVSYALPVSIVSNSEGYDVNPELKTIVYEIKVVNGFSGDYSGSSTELPSTVRSVQPTLKALSANKVRMPIHTKTSSDLNTDFMVLTIADDSVSVSITPWENAKVKDLGNSMYDKKRQSFVLNYSIEDNDGDVMSIREKIINLDAPVVDEDDSE